MIDDDDAARPEGDDSLGALWRDHHHPHGSRSAIPGQRPVSRPPASLPAVLGEAWATGRPLSVAEAWELADQLAPIPREVGDTPPGLSGWWGSLRPVTEVSDAADYLRSRGLDPHAVADRDLARAVPAGARVPRWASYPGGGYRLVVPMWDEAGRLATVRLRRVAGEPWRGCKSVAPRGHSPGKAVFACALGRQMLASEWDDTTPWWWSRCVPLDVVFVEGEIDHLTVATAYSGGDEYAPVVLGTVSGGWDARLAGRVPRGARVYLDHDQDETGDRYAAQVAGTLGDRMVHRTCAADVAA